jgi:hypothetical protein
MWNYLEISNYEMGGNDIQTGIRVWIDKAWNHSRSGPLRQDAVASIGSKIAYNSRLTYPSSNQDWGQR